MKFVRVATDGVPRLGVLVDVEIREVPDPFGSMTLEHALAQGRDALREIGSASATGARRPLDGAPLLAPLACPGKVMCVGQNYAAHAAESNVEAPAEPIFFSKFGSSVTGPNDPILLPKAAPRRVDYEAELAVVIGRRGRDIPEAAAMDFVAGYMVANDVSARDWQVKKPAGQWLLGKSFDTFLPLGPALVTADEVEDPRVLRVMCRLGGETVQDDVVEHMIFDLPTLISYVSRVATLEPGDVLLTGTPAGVGQSRVPPRWLHEGDLLETEIPGLGVLRNPVRAA